MTLRWMRRLLRGMRPATDDRNVDAELRLHVELETEDLISRGMPPAEARRRALLTFGGVERFKSEARDARLGRWLTILPAECRWAWRGIRRRSVGAAVHVLLVALAVGASATVFSAADSFVFRTSPYPNATRLVTFQRTSPVGVIDSLQPNERAALTARPDLLTRFYTYKMGPTLYTSPGGVTQAVRTYDVEPGLFDAFGVAPIAGRPFVQGDEAPDRDRVGLIREDLARSLFSDPAAAIGQVIGSGANALRIVGVMPTRFRFPTALERVWRPQRDGGFATLGVVAPGVSTQDVQHAVTAMAQAQPPADSMGPVAAVALSSAMKDPRAFTNAGSFSTANAPRLFTMLLGAAICVTLIICLNVAGLSLARALERAPVYVVQSALGASRASLVRMTMIEDGILTVAGAVGGLALAAWGTAILSAALPPALATILTNPIDLDVRTVAFIAALTSAAALLTSLPMAWRASRTALAGQMRSASPVVTVSRGQASFRYVFVTGQVGLSVVLLIVAILFTRSYGARLGDKGFDSRDLVTIQVTQPPSPSQQATDLEQTIAGRLSAYPGVLAFSRTARLPPNGPRGGTASRLWIDGASTPTGSLGLVPFDVDPDYFKTVGIRILEGRVPQPGDPPDRIVVDEEFARRFWPNGGALGARFSLGTDAARGRTGSEIGGIASHMSLDTAALPQGGDLFVIYRVLKRDAAPLTFVARLAAPGGLADISTLVRALAPDSVIRVAPIDDRYAESYGDTRIAAGVGSGFGALAFVVAIVGLYGVTTFVASGRTREMGVRIALGAGRGEVQRLVLAPAMRSAAIGAAGGIAAALVASYALRSQFFGVSASDPFTYASVALVVSAIALAAAWLPARRAAGVDPAITLKAE